MRTSILLLAVAACWRGSAPVPPSPPPPPIPAASPWDGIHLAIFDNGVQANDATGHFHPLTGATRQLTWSRGGTGFFAEADGGLVRCDPAGCRSIAMPAWSGYQASPGGTRILVTPKDNKLPGVIVDVATGARREVPASYGVWLDDEHIVRIVQPTRQLRSYDLRTGTDRPLGTPAVVGVASMSPSPDGRRLAYVGVRRVEHENGSIRTFYGVGLFDTVTQRWGRYITGTLDHLPMWSPDSTRLSYATERGVATLDIRTNAISIATSSGIPLGWVDDHRLVYQRLDHVDDSDVRSHGHGFVDAWCDVAVRDYTLRREIELTQGGFVHGCQTRLAPAPVTARSSVQTYPHGE